ncbi:winged helix-turn-helix domain-containing protein [Micromonospora sp. NBC_00389]|uniref:ArsR/SmtB family transcription factor n=1 Tax=Micromonospora sp. NBC_00389 TaxID=2903586 RepID=UPI002E1ECD97
MIDVEFTPDDLSRVRFAHSPLAELVASSWALRKPAKYWLHRPWLERAERLLPGAGLEPLLAVLGSPTGYVPDFLTPIGVAPNLAAELRAVAGTDPARVRRQLERAGVPALAPDELVAQLRRYFTLLIAPDWPRLRALALADIRRRTLLAAEQGGRTLLRELHPSIRWDGASLRVAVGTTRPTGLDGRPWTLLPTAFAGPSVHTIIEGEAGPALCYPPGGLGGLWASPVPSPALGALLGSTRAAALSLLDTPLSTGELAAMLGLAPATASHHLTTLRDNGLIAGVRRGRTVCYARTVLGDQLVG